MRMAGEEKIERDRFLRTVATRLALVAQPLSRHRGMVKQRGHAECTEVRVPEPSSFFFHAQVNIYNMEPALVGRLPPMPMQQAGEAPAPPLRGRTPGFPAALGRYWALPGFLA